MIRGHPHLIYRRKHGWWAEVITPHIPEETRLVSNRNLGEEQSSSTPHIPEETRLMSRGHRTSYTGGNTVDEQRSSHLIYRRKHGWWQYHHTSYTGGNTVDDNIKARKLPYLTKPVGQSESRPGENERRTSTKKVETDWPLSDNHRRKKRRTSTLDGGLIDLYQNEWQIW